MDLHETGLQCLGTRPTRVPRPSATIATASRWRQGVLGTLVTRVPASYARRGPAPGAQAVAAGLPTPGRMSRSMRLAGAAAVLVSLWMPWYAIHVPDSLRSQIDANAGRMPPGFAAFAQGLLAAIPQNLHVNAWQAFGGADVAMAFLAGGLVLLCFATADRSISLAAAVGARSPSSRVHLVSRPGRRRRGDARPPGRGSPLAGAVLRAAGAAMSDGADAVVPPRRRPGRCLVRVGRWPSSRRARGRPPRCTRSRGGRGRSRSSSARGRATACASRCGCSGRPRSCSSRTPPRSRRSSRPRPTCCIPGEGARLLEPVVGSNSLILLDEDAHLRQRRLMLPAFHGESVRALTGLMTAVAEREVASWPKNEPIALHPRMQALTLEIILRAVFGLDEGPRLDALRERFAPILELGGGPFVTAPPLRRDFPGSPWSRFRAPPRRGRRADLRADRRAPRERGGPRRHPRPAAQRARRRGRADDPPGAPRRAHDAARRRPRDDGLRAGLGDRAPAAHARGARRGSRARSARATATPTWARPSPRPCAGARCWPTPSRA